MTILDLPSGYITNGIPYALGQPSITYPLKADANYARVWEQTYFISGSYNFATGFQTGGMFSGSYIVQDSDRAAVGNDCYTFTRSFAEIPVNHNTFETFSYVYPGLTTGHRSIMLLTVLSRIGHEYVYTATPETLPLSGVQRFISQYGWDNTVLSSSTLPTELTYSGWVVNGTEFVAEDSSITRYMGNIWDRQTRWIKAK
jgi:hypothetical protein